jgi:LPS export ABC transporter protein LptC
VRRLLRLLSAVLLFLTVCVLWPRELDGFAPGRDGRLVVPDYAMTNARYVSVQDGKVEVESFSRDAAYDLHRRRMDAADVTAYFYDAENQKTEVKADRAVFHMDERRVHLQDNVRSLSPDGFLMRGSEADYHMDKRFLRAPQPVEGETADRALRVWGDSAETAIDEKKVNLIGNARSEIKDKKKGLTKIRGDHAELDREKHEVVFQENVKVEQDKTVGTSRLGHLYYSGRERELRYLSLRDDVKILEEGGRYTRSQVAEFFAPTDTIVLSVFPALYDGDDVVTGDRITLYRATGVVEVTATNAAGNPERLNKDQIQSRPFSSEDEELIP